MCVNATRLTSLFFSFFGLLTKLLGIPHPNNNKIYSLNYTLVALTANVGSYSFVYECMRSEIVRAVKKGDNKLFETGVLGTVDEHLKNEVSLTDVHQV